MSKTTYKIKETFNGEVCYEETFANKNEAIECFQMLHRNTLVDIDESDYHTVVESKDDIYKVIWYKDDKEYCDEVRLIEIKNENEDK